MKNIVFIIFIILLTSCNFFYGASTHETARGINVEISDSLHLREDTLFTHTLDSEDGGFLNYVNLSERYVQYSGFQHMFLLSMPLLTMDIPIYNLQKENAISIFTCIQGNVFYSIETYYDGIDDNVFCIAIDISDPENLDVLKVTVLDILPEDGNFLHIEDQYPILKSKNGLVAEWGGNSYGYLFSDILNQDNLNGTLLPFSGIDSINGNILISKYWNLDHDYLDIQFHDVTDFNNVISSTIFNDILGSELLFTEYYYMSTNSNNLDIFSLENFSDITRNYINFTGLISTSSFFVDNYLISYGRISSIRGNHGLCVIDFTNDTEYEADGSEYELGTFERTTSFKNSDGMVGEINEEIDSIVTYGSFIIAPAGEQLIGVFTVSPEGQIELYKYIDLDYYYSGFLSYGTNWLFITDYDEYGQEIIVGFVDLNTI